MIKDCLEENKRLVPLSKVVKSAILDTYQDLNVSQQRYTHWAGRSWQDLNRQVFKSGTRKVLIQVNENTKTATLPVDFESETFVGYIDLRGQKIPFKVNNRLADGCNFEETESEDKCTSCGQDKTICEDLQVTEDIELVVINDTTYENSVIKKLYPNGDYYLETTKYILDLGDNTVNPITTKEFITNFGLKPCGCLETTVDNIANIKTNSYPTYCNYYAECNCDCGDYGYKIFPESGLIQFDYNFPFTQIALEYTGFMPKKNGQFMVPAVAFETLVAKTKFMAIRDKKGVEFWRIRSAEESYVKERKIMMKVLTRVSLSSIIDASRRAPSFNIDFGNDWYGYFGCNSALSLLNGSSGGSSSSTTTGGSTTIITNPTTIINNGSYQLSVKVGLGIGHPVDGQSSYQNNLLKSATDLNYLIVANQIYTKDVNFTFNSVTGTIDLSPNIFIQDDTVIIPYNKIS